MATTTLVNQTVSREGSTVSPLSGLNVHRVQFTQAPVNEHPFLLDMARSVVESARFTISSGALAGRQFISPGGGGNYYGAVKVVRDDTMAMLNCPWLFTASQVQGACEINIACHNAAPDGGVQDGCRQDSSIFGYGGGGITPSPMDNTYWMIFGFWLHFQKTGNASLFATHETAIMEAWNAHTIQDGLVYADGSAVEYGFVDSIQLVGKVSFVSLMRFSAAQCIIEMLQSLDRGSEVGPFQAEKAAISEGLLTYLYDEEAHMLRFCTEGENVLQHSVAATAYAVCIGAFTGTILDSISLGLAQRLPGGSNSGQEIVLHGQAYVFPTSDPYFTQFRTGISDGAYQNGGAWATHTGLLCQALARTNVPASNWLMGEWATYNMGLSSSVRPYEVESRPGGGSWTPSYPYVASATNPLGRSRRIV